MLRISLFAALLNLGMVAAHAQQDKGLVGRWDFDEGGGAVIRDASGFGNDGQVRGATWLKRGQGYALSFDGVDDYVDCGNGSSLDLTETVSLEAWAKPGSLPANEPMIFGKYYDSYGFTHYRDGNTWFYISGGGNNINGRLEIGQWSHIVATFDGTTMTLYVNREKVGAKKSKASKVNHGRSFLMGVLMADPNATDPGYSGTSYWRGTLDDVRVYNRSLSEEEVLNHYKQAAGGFGVDTTWFDRLRVVTYQFRAEKRLLALFDYSGVFPRPADASLVADLVREGETPAEPLPLQKQKFKPLPNSGRLCASFPLTDLPPGRYAVRGKMTASGGMNITGQQEFACPAAEIRVPSPVKLRVMPLPAAPSPPRYGFELHPGGGFTIAVKGRRLPFESSYSYPHGGENRLLAGPRDAKGEPAWQVMAKRTGKDAYEVAARGQYYTLSRRIRLYANRINVQDTVSNSSAEDLGLILDNYLDATKQPFHDSTVAGYPHAVERKESQSPSTFVAWKDLGLGMVPLDDVTIVQSTVWARGNRAGIKTDRFGLAPKAWYTLEWAVYPTTTPDYYDFLNAVRHDEKRTGTVEGGFAFIPRQNVSREYVALRNTLYGSFGCLTNVADDPQIEIEGIDFLWLPKERARLRSEFEAIRKVNPHLKLMFHVAHSLVSTNKPETLFPDSRVLDANGKQVLYAYDYDACAYFSPQRHKEGWRWYIYYPTLGNSFHEALMKSVDVMMDDIGCGGVFMDGFFFGYGSGYTYDRWDGHTVEMDRETKTIKRKVGSVLLLSQPSMAEFTRRMVAKGGVVVANNVVQTRTISALPIIVDQECRSGPDVHLAQTPCALGNPTIIRSEVDVYRDVLDKLKWGNLYFYYGEGTLTYPSLPQQMFPITVEEIRSGTITGKERIITMHSGVYGWPHSKELHLSYRYNPVGVPIPAEFLTTMEANGVRTQVQLEPQESAVIKKIPLFLTASQPVNLVCEKYDASGIVMTLNGQGKAELQVKDGEFPVKPGARYRVSTSAQPLIPDRAGVLRVPLTLGERTQLVVEPSEAASGAP